MAYPQVMLGSRRESRWWERARYRWPAGFKIDAGDDGVGAHRQLNGGGYGIGRVGASNISDVALPRSQVCAILFFEGSDRGSVNHGSSWGTTDFHL